MLLLLCKNLHSTVNCATPTKNTGSCRAFRPQLLLTLFATKHWRIARVWRLTKNTHTHNRVAERTMRKAGPGPVRYSTRKAGRSSWNLLKYNNTITHTSRRLPACPAFYANASNAKQASKATTQKRWRWRRRCCCCMMLKLCTRLLGWKWASTWAGFWHRMCGCVCVLGGQGLLKLVAQNTANTARRQ